MRAGKLRESVSVVRIVPGTEDELGGETAATESTVGTIRADIERVRGQSREVADREKGVQTYRMTVRNQGTGKAITAEDVIVWDGERLDVVSAPNAGRDRWRVLEIEAGVVTGG